MASAQAQVKQAQAALEQAKLDLSHTYITAPVDGVVVARHVDVGQTVAASLQAPTLFEIAQDLTKMQVDTNVSEADVGHLRVGMPASFTVDAYPGEAFRGKVTQIRQAPINVQNVVTYPVIVSAENPDLKLFPGMTANIACLVARHEQVLKVPNAALRFKPADDETSRPQAPAGHGAGPRRQTARLWVRAGSGLDPVPVQTGITDGSWTEVRTDRLQEGAEVVVSASNGAAQKEEAGTVNPFMPRMPGHRPR